MSFFYTDFIKNKTIQQAIVLGLTFDILLSQRIIHVLIVFGLPYCASVVLNQLPLAKAKNRTRARISEQFRPKDTTSIQITPIDG